MENIIIGWVIVVVTGWLIVWIRWGLSLRKIKTVKYRCPICGNTQYVLWIMTPVLDEVECGACGARAKRAHFWHWPARLRLKDG